MKYLFVVILLMGCGIKGPPLPPITEETIQKDKLNAEEAKSKPNTTAAPAESTDGTRAVPAKKK